MTITSMLYQWDALSTIKAGQEVGTFNGTMITTGDAANMTPTRGGYLLNLSTDEGGAGQKLDCYHEAQHDPSMCKLSMANTAEGLYNRLANKSLTAEHNNAAVTVMMRNGQPC